MTATITNSHTPRVCRCFILFPLPGRPPCYDPEPVKWRIPQRERGWKVPRPAAKIELTGHHSGWMVVLMHYTLLAPREGICKILPLKGLIFSQTVFDWIWKTHTARLHSFFLPLLRIQPPVWLSTAHLKQVQIFLIFIVTPWSLHEEWNQLLKVIHQDTGPDVDTSWEQSCNEAFWTTHRT